jgi:cytochrome c oxidase subunit III
MGTSLTTSSAMPGRPGPRRTLTDSARFGMGLFIFTEVMLFAGFISAFIIVQSGAPAGSWPPPGQPRLPIERTAINTLALLASGVALFIAGRKFHGPPPGTATPWMGAALALGTFFVVGQGMEWTALLSRGLTMTSSQMGSFFYLIVGMHALHAVAAIVALAWAWRAQLRGRLSGSRLGAVQLFWYFVVLIWPILYWKVYL